MSEGIASMTQTATDAAPEVGLTVDALDTPGLYFGTQGGSVWVSPNEGDDATAITAARNRERNEYHDEERGKSRFTPRHA